MANQHSKPFKAFGNSGVHMHRDKWFSLDGNSKEIWDQLDDKAKYTILGYSNNETIPVLV
jgi:hypothetical protein